MKIKILYKIIINYFLLNVVTAIARLFNIDLQYDKVLDLAILSIIILDKNEDSKAIDSLIIYYLIYMMLTIIVNEYPNKGIITYYAVKTTWIPIFLYFVGRKKALADYCFFEKMIIPISFSIISGIILHITRPNWYVVMRTINLSEYTNDEILNEAFRMSSFWPAPQFLGYSTFVLYTYLLFDLYTKQFKFYRILLIILCLISIFLIQLRVVILGVGISTLIFIFWSYFFGNLRNKKLSILIVLFVSSLAIIVSSIGFIFNNNYLIQKINTIFTFNTLAVDRINSMREAQAAKIYEINAFGHGMGRFGISVAKFNMPDLRDGGYLKELLELGYLGFTIFIIFIFKSFIRAVRFIKYLPFEFCILIYFLIALIGSNCISEDFTLNAVFWLNLGRIWNRNIILKKSNVIIKYT